MTESRTPAGASHRWRRWLFLLAPPALVALYAAAGFLLVPWLAERELPRYFDARLQLAAKVEDVAFNPFTLRARMRGFAAAERSGAPVLSIDEAQIKLLWRSLVERAPIVDEVRLSAPSLRIRVAEDGRVNLAEIAARMATADEAPAQGEDAGPPRFSIGRAAIAGGQVSIEDAQAGFQETFKDLDLEVTALTTLERQDGTVRVDARSAGGAVISWSGRISALARSVQGTFTLKDLPLEPLSPYAVRGAGLRIAGKLTDLRLPHRISIASGSARASIEKATLNVEGLALESDAGDLPALRVEALAIEDIDADSAARKASVRSLRITGFSAAGRPDSGTRASVGEIGLAGLGVDLASAQGALESLDARAIEYLTQAGEAPLARIENFSAQGLRAALAAREIDLKYVRVASARFSVRREATGAIDVGAWPARATAETPEAGTSQGWKIAAAAIDLDDVSGLYRDGSTKRPVELGVGPLAAKLALQVTAEPSGAAIQADLGASQIGEVAVRESATAEPLLRATDVSLASAQFDSRAHLLSLGALQLGDVKARIEADGGRLAVLDLVPDTGPPAGTPLALKLASAEVKSVEVAYADRASGAAANVVGGRLSLSALSLSGAQAEAGQVSFAARDLRYADPSAGLDAQIGSLALEASGVARHKETVRGASARLALGRVSFADGKAGRNASASEITLRTTGLAAAGARLTAERAEFTGAAADYAERDSGLALGLVRPRGTFAGFSSEGDRPTRFEIASGLKAGGRIAAKGSGVLAKRTLEARIEGSEIALAQVEPFLRPHADIRIGSGLAAVSGQLTAGGASQLTFDGGVLVANLSLLDADREPIVRWKALETPAMKFALAPLQVRVGELRWDEPEARVRVNPDRSINVGRVLVPRDTAAEKPAADAKHEAAPLALGIRRIKVSGARLDFADDSVTPGFNTRIHSLGGTINGLSTDPDTRGRFSLEGEVDENGHAVVSGTINPFVLREGTQVRMQLRGLDLTRVTPYAIKFAGYRIAAGSVSLDLKYRIDGGTIAGDNQIVLDEFTLGERVDSPDALNLPIELAVALLRDPDGRINVGLKVHGNLDDPKFDYGEIIGKALGNLVTGIVAAPFRVLAGLLAGAGDDFGVVRFDPGSAKLLPSERAKLAKVAQALAQRPDLMIRVPARFDAESDARALRTAALNREIARRAGLEADENADSGPLTADDRPTRQAVQALFEERFGKAAGDSPAKAAPLAAASESASPDKLPAPGAGRASETLPSPEKAAAAAARAAAFDATVARLRETQPLPDKALESLAARRAEAIAKALGKAGVDTERIEIETAAPLSVPDAEQVTVQLALTAK